MLQLMALERERAGQAEALARPRVRRAGEIPSDFAAGDSAGDIAKPELSVGDLDARARLDRRPCGKVRQAEGHQPQERRRVGGRDPRCSAQARRERLAEQHHETGGDLHLTHELQRRLAVPGCRQAGRHPGVQRLGPGV